MVHQTWHNQHGVWIKGCVVQKHYISFSISFILHNDCFQDRTAYLTFSILSCLGLLESVKMSKRESFTCSLIYWLRLALAKEFVFVFVIAIWEFENKQGCIFRLTCSHPELTEDHVLTSAFVKIFRTVTRNAVNKSVWRKKDCSWLPLNKHAMNIWLSSLRTGKNLHVLHVLRIYSTCSYPGY